MVSLQIKFQMSDTVGEQMQEPLQFWLGQLDMNLRKEN